MTKYLIAMLLAASVSLVVMFLQLRNTSAALDTQTSIVGQLQAASESRKNTMRLLTQLDQQHTEERERANQEIANLRSDVAAGRRRLSVAASCPVRDTTSATGLDHAQARADIDPSAAERIVRIASDGDDAIRALSALQDYVRTSCFSTSQ